MIGNSIVASRFAEYVVPFGWLASLFQDLHAVQQACRILQGMVIWAGSENDFTEAIGIFSQVQAFCRFLNEWQTIIDVE